MDRIYFLAKDPHWTWIWWQLSEETVKNIIDHNSQSTVLEIRLRIHDITDIIFDGNNSHSRFDVTVCRLCGGMSHEVSWREGFWYVRIPVCNRCYCVEVGLISLDQQNGQETSKFTASARSNTVCLPRDSPSEDASAVWSTIKLEEG